VQSRKTRLWQGEDDVHEPGQHAVDGTPEISCGETDDHSHDDSKPEATTPTSSDIRAP